MSGIIKHYVGEVGGDVIIDMQEDLTGATNVSMLIKKPDGTTVTWTASLYTEGGHTNFLKHAIIAGDLDQAGKYEAHPVLTLSTWTGKGKTVSFIVYDLYS